MSIYEEIKQKTSLALVYVEDGAFITAAKRLRAAAEMLESHAAATFPSPKNLAKWAEEEGEQIASLTEQAGER